MTVLLDERTGTSVRRDDVVRAMRTVIVYTVTDVFDLAEEESMWVSYHVENILRQVEGMTPRSIASPVRHELQTGEYSKRLSASLEAEHFPTRASGRTTQADVTDWATVLSDVITQSYMVRPMLALSIVGQISGILVELGVGDPVNPRASRYLPNSVRHAINASS